MGNEIKLNNGRYEQDRGDFFVLSGEANELYRMLWRRLQFIAQRSIVCPVLRAINKPRGIAASDIERLILLSLHISS